VDGLEERVPVAGIKAEPENAKTIDTTATIARSR
jgi:hypothetical protein